VSRGPNILLALFKLTVHADALRSYAFSAAASGPRMGIYDLKDRRVTPRQDLQFHPAATVQEAHRAN
jgi:hypothetical protein